VATHNYTQRCFCGANCMCLHKWLKMVWNNGPGFFCKLLSAFLWIYNAHCILLIFCLKLSLTRPFINYMYTGTLTLRRITW
jgi:hypothetical protein